MQIRKLHDDLGENHRHRISRKSANWMFFAYLLCLVFNLGFALYYLIKLGALALDSAHSLVLVALYFYHSDAIYADFPAIIYIACVSRYFRQEIDGCGRSWSAKLEGEHVRK